MKDLIAWFAKNSVVASLLLVLIVAGGLLAVGDLKQEVYADFALDVITVRANYRGAGPEDVEEAICIRLEEAVQGIEGIKKITTTATEGRGSMVPEVYAAAGGDRSKSGEDWAWTREQLRAGRRPADFEAELASRRPDKSNPASYAKRTVERAVESLARRQGPTR